MPNVSRGPSAHAVVDADLSAWAAARGLHVTPGRIARWRSRGLLPAPTATAVQRPDQRPGRTAANYTQDELRIARAVIELLARVSRPGRPMCDVALIVYAHGFALPYEVVVRSLREVSGRGERWIRDHINKAVELAAAVDRSWAMSETYEQAEAAADLSLSRRDPMSRLIRTNLRAGGQPADRESVRSALISLFLTVLKDPPEHDLVAVEQMMFGFRAHGLVELQADGGEPVLVDGSASYAASLRITADLGRELPDDVESDELAVARSVAGEFQDYLRSLTEGELVASGGPMLLGLWDPDDPLKIATAIIYWVLFIRHLRSTGDLERIIESAS